MSGGISVRGGAGGIHARLDDFEHAAGILDTAAGDLGRVLAQAQSARESVARIVAVPLAPLSGIRLHAMLADFHLRSGTAGADLAGTAAALRLTADGYRRAERTAEHAIATAAWGAGYGLGLLANRAAFAVGGAAVIAGAAAVSIAGSAPLLVIGGGIWLATGGAEQLGTAGADLGQQAGDSLQDLSRDLIEHPGLAQPLVEHVLPGFVSGFFALPPGVPGAPQDSADMAGLILLIGRGFGAFTRTDVEVDRRDLDIAPERAQAPADAGELFSRTVEAHRDKDNGEVHIDEMIGPDGTRRWIIYVPATTNFGAVPGEAGTDLTTNVETAAGQDTVMQETVRQAIADAGIDPDEEVMLVGYSQGGMTAASLAADAEFRSDVNVTSILTVGSPVGDAEIPPGIDVLSIEHTQDPVPMLDGRNNPQRADWTSAQIDVDLETLRDYPQFAGRSDAEIAAAISRPDYAHSSSLYRESIERLLAADDSSVQAWATGSAGFLTGTTASRRAYTGRRTDG